MTRKHKSENQKPVSDCSREAPGSQKRKRDEAIEQENQVLKKQATACFGKWISNTPKNSEVGKEVVSHEVQAANEKIIGDEIQVCDAENTTNRAAVQLADDDGFGEEVELQIHTISEDVEENDACPEKAIEQNDLEGEVDLFDPATWPRLMSSSLKQQIIFSKFEAGPDLGNLTPDTRRYLKGFAFGEKPNGESFQRDWIRVSSTTNSVYCLPCCLFGKGKTTSWNNFGVNEKGFHDFNHPGRGTSSHESSLAHQESIRIWKINLKEKETGTNLTSAALEKIEKQVSEWRLILRGILDAVLYLAQHNLAFQGNSKDLSALDNGNFLGLIKLLSKYYQPLEKHLNRLEHRKVSYLSPQIQNEFIELCGKTVKSEVLKKIKSRKYYSIMFDSTPDLSKHDQLSEVVRSVHCSDQGCHIEESFIDFISCPGKTGAQLSDTILKKLEEDKLNLSDCKGQGYDNGANMAGCYQGVQSHIIRQNPEARFLPCAAHSLYLVGANSVESVRVGKLLLGEIQNLYLFFSGSTSRWEVLLKHSKITLKHQCATRWSAKAEAVRSVWEHW